MSKIECCNGCVAPKRHPGCHSTCGEYKAERAALDETNAVIRKKRYERYALDCQRIRAIKKTREEGRWH